MTFDSHSVTLKIWDPSTIDHALEEAVTHVSTVAGAHRDHVRVTRSGPDVFTVHVGEPV